MIELIPTWFILVVCAATMMVNRAGASRVFFDVIGVFYANRMLKDAKAKMATLQALALDGLSGIEDAASMFGAKMAALTDEVIPIANRIADARIEFEKFVESSANADKIAKDVIDIGQGFGFTADQALLAAARMAQLSSVVGPDVIPAATQVGMEFGLIGGMGTEEAMTKLINLQQQTGFMLGDLTLEQFRAMDAEEQANIVRENSIATLDQLNTIENRSAATMQHMTFVMNQFASQADLANESIAGMAAQSATLIEAGEEQGKAGRALKQIYARLGADTSGAATEIEKLGVATTDANGDMRALTQIVNELAPEYAKLNGEQKTNLAIAVAGTHHYARFIKLMENNERTQELMIQSTLGLSPAMDEVNIRLKNQVTVLRDAEAKLDKYKGTLGDALTPSVIMATEVQAEYNKQLTAVFGGTAGGALNNIFGVAKVIQDTASGFYQNYVNIVQMNVALATQKVLTAALRGEEMIREDFMATKIRGRQKYNNLLTQELQEQNDKMAFAKQIASELLMDSEKRHLMEINVTDEQLQQMYQQFTLREGAIGILETTVQQLRVKNSMLSMDGRSIEIQRQQAENRKTALGDSLIELEILLEKAQEELQLAQEEAKKDRRLKKRLAKAKEELAVAEEQYSTMRLQTEEAEKHFRELEKQHIAHQKILGASEEEIADMYSQIELSKEQNAQLALEIGYGEANLENKRQQNEVEQAGKAADDHRKESVEIGKKANMYTSLAMSVMGVGSAMMMMAGATEDAEKREKRMRVAMVMMNAAMIPQIIEMSKLTKGIMGASFFTDKFTMENIRYAATAARTSFANKGVAGSFRAIGIAATTAATGVQTAGRAMMRALAPMALLVAAGYAVTAALEHMGLFGDADAFAETGSASLQETTDALENNTKSITQLANEIVEYENEIERMADLEGQQYEDRKNQLLDLIALNQRLMGVVGADEAERLGFDKLAEDLFAMKSELSDIEDTFGKFDPEENDFDKAFDAGALEGAGIILNRVVLGATGNMSDSADRAAELTEEINNLLETNTDFANFLESQGITDIDLFTEALIQNDKVLEDLQKTLNGTEGDLGGVNSEVENALQLFDEFNNAREELFFGFKAGNVTGDLVKQIQQKGVENFVANTEIIMTNNFNGMTTDQVADEILRKINERAVTNGINLSTT